MTDRATDRPRPRDGQDNAGRLVRGASRDVKGKQEPGQPRAAGGVHGSVGFGKLHRASRPPVFWAPRTARPVLLLAPPLRLLAFPNRIPAELKTCLLQKVYLDCSSQLSLCLQIQYRPSSLSEFQKRGTVNPLPIKDSFGCSFGTITPTLLEKAESASPGGWCGLDQWTGVHLKVVAPSPSAPPPGSRVWAHEAPRSPGQGQGLSPHSRGGPGASSPPVWAQARFPWVLVKRPALYAALVGSECVSGHREPEGQVPSCCSALPPESDSSSLRRPPPLPGSGPQGAQGAQPSWPPWASPTPGQPAGSRGPLPSGARCRAKLPGWGSCQRLTCPFRLVLGMPLERPRVPHARREPALGPGSSAVRGPAWSREGRGGRARAALTCMPGPAARRRSRRAVGAAGRARRRVRPDFRVGLTPAAAAAAAAAPRCSRGGASGRSRGLGRLPGDPVTGRGGPRRDGGPRGRTPALRHPPHLKPPPLPLALTLAHSQGTPPPLPSTASSLTPPKSRADSLVGETGARRLEDETDSTGNYLLPPEPRLGGPQPGGPPGLRGRRRGHLHQDPRSTAPSVQPGPGRQLGEALGSLRCLTGAGTGPAGKTPLPGWASAPQVCQKRSFPSHQGGIRGAEGHPRLSLQCPLSKRPPPTLRELPGGACACGGAPPLLRRGLPVHPCPGGRPPSPAASGRHDGHRPQSCCATASLPPHWLVSTSCDRPRRSMRARGGRTTPPEDPPTQATPRRPAPASRRGDPALGGPSRCVGGAPGPQWGRHISPPWPLRPGETAVAPLRLGRRLSAQFGSNTHTQEMIPAPPRGWPECERHQLGREKKGPGGWLTGTQACGVIAGKTRWGRAACSARLSLGPASLTRRVNPCGPVPWGPTPRFPHNAAGNGDLVTPRAPPTHSHIRTLENQHSEAGCPGHPGDPTWAGKAQPRTSRGRRSLALSGGSAQQAGAEVPGSAGEEGEECRGVRVRPPGFAWAAPRRGSPGWTRTPRRLATRPRVPQAGSGYLATGQHPSQQALLLTYDVGATRPSVPHGRRRADYKSHNAPPTLS
ncbi:basic proline-rich protein-like [Cynocephalus volans]|uniref:basic proline-rich protein-like n=1 Tax=Cynocephalus volans TaxID=110931 RepID=UPI002FCBF443